MNAATLQQAAGLMSQGRFADARRLLEPVARAMPGSADARYLLGAALRRLGDLTGAETELRAALTLDAGREDAALDLARVLAATEQFEAVLTVTAPFVSTPCPAEALLSERARALKALDRMDACVEARERIVALYPGKAATTHNLAAALGDSGLPERAETAAREAMRLGGDAPETWLVLARALQSQNRFDEADTAFAAAIARRPAYVDALRDRAQLAWMRSGDLAAALAVLAPERSARPSDPALRALEAKLHEYAGDERAAYRIVTAGGAMDAALELAAAHLSMGVDPGAALAHAQRAAALAPEAEAVQRKLIDVELAAGRPDSALSRAEAWLARRPLDQGLIAAQWTAWRLLDDPRAAPLYDYATMVRAWTIDMPAGWSTLDAYLADLGAALSDLHKLDAHPFDQSLRNGVQTTVSLLRSETPAIRAFPSAIDGPIRSHMAALGTGDDPLRRRNTGDYRIKGMWSVRLRPGGFHVDHVHPLGWLSSACYVQLPERVNSASHEGWIKFGEPGIPTRPPLVAEHFVQPQAGQVVLFPSYMWHGTAPFSGEGRRLTIAFDIVPA